MGRTPRRGLPFLEALCEVLADQRMGVDRCVIRSAESRVFDIGRNEPEFRQTMERRVPLGFAQAHQRLGEAFDHRFAPQRTETTEIGRAVEQTQQA